MNSRRDALKAIGMGSLGLVTASSAAIASAETQTLANVPNAFSRQFTIKPLTFKPDTLDGISEQVIVSHWENNYAGSIRALNTIKARLSAALSEQGLPAFVYNDLKREHLMRTGSVVLHELYFENLSPPQARNAELDQALTAAFGSVANWEKEFKLIGAGLGGGSGWVMLAWNQHLTVLENYWMADHMHCPAYVSPILLMDMYEHSYHMDYGAAAGNYIDAFMRNINWQVVAARLDSARA